MSNVLLALAACGGGSGETGASGSTTGTSAGPTTGGEPTSSGPATSATTSDGDSGGSGGATTSSTSAGGTGVSTSMSTSTPGETGMGDSSGGSDSGGQFTACTKDEDCTLVDDCCSCEPIGPGEDAPGCDVPECITTTCGPMGLDGAPLACLFGRCTFVKIDCNPVTVSCDEAAPECPGLLVASVDEDSGCWTGQCVPAEACNWVPDCAYCDDDESICVDKLQKGPFTVCAPKPVDCGDVADVDCTCAAQVCEASPPHTVCHDVMGDIACECPQC